MAVEASQAREILPLLPPESASVYSTWRSVAAGLKGIGDPTLYKDFYDWSRQAANFGGCRELWDGLTGTGLAGLLKVAEQFGVRPQSTGRKPCLRLTPELDTVIPALEAIAAKADGVYQRGGLVALSRDVDPPANSIVASTSTKTITLRSQALPERLAQIANFEKWSAQKRDWIRCSVSQDLANQLVARGYWPNVPKLSGIVPSAVLLPDGSILTTPGYDKESGLYLDSQDKYPAMPSVADAVDLINSVVVDFPFESPCHQAAWVAMLLSLFGQYACGGNAPLFLIDANVCGCGKGLLVDAALGIYDSHTAGKVGAPTNDDEWRKLISTIAAQSWSYAVFDNVVGRFGGSSFERALTTTRWQDRRLGLNEDIDMPLHVIWVATGNNCHLASKDMARRTVHIRLESPLENPQLRTTFVHSNLLKYVRENRTTLAMAALAILKGYVDAGKPNQLPDIGSFAEWSGLVRSAVVWAGWTDPCVSSARLIEDDEGTQLLRELLNAWPGPSTSAEAVSLAAEDAKLRLAIESVTGGRYNSQALGVFLRSVKKTVVDDKRFVPAPGRRWQVEKI
ncbi:PriCT-2 domain-containing protein [Lacipirellula parvula]|uniref:PriCT-2 domain-containing protein n=1 Tax=Lacipirellula parvula TaxID=2650471 RepID=UPI00156241CC|nr:PriCT-2 domain-containing protein [Lacipirellula parvula]